MSTDSTAFYAKLEADGVEKVRASLAQGGYASDKRALVEEWLHTKDVQREAILAAYGTAIQRGDRLLKERRYFSLIAHNSRQLLDALHTLGTAISSGKPLVIWYALIGFLVQLVGFLLQVLVIVGLPIGLLVLLWYVGKRVFF